MKEFMQCFLSPATGLIWLALLAPVTHAQAEQQAFCASDGQAAPVQLLERFINAECENCWQDPGTLKAKPGQAVLDWIVPGASGDAAALSVVAGIESFNRLQALNLAVPARSGNNLKEVKPLAGASLRVAHGLALTGYLGASIEFKPAVKADPDQALTAWLALVETLPAGTEGSPVARHLVRNSIAVIWNGNDAALSSDAPAGRRFESRVMSVAGSANAEQLRVIGWLENSAGEVVMAAQSACEDLAEPAEKAKTTLNN
jgi:hypothetical protein